jgi:hypothetical protein
MNISSFNAQPIDCPAFREINPLLLFMKAIRGIYYIDYFLYSSFSTFKVGRNIYYDGTMSRKEIRRESGMWVEINKGGLIETHPLIFGAALAPVKQNDHE